MLTPTPYQKVIESLKNIKDDVGQMNVDRKRTEEGRQKYFKTNVCEKRWRVTYCGVSLLLTFTQIQLADRLTKENFEHNGSTIKYLKSPSVDAGVFRHKLIGSPIQLNKYKDADESDKNISDLKHKNVNDTNNCSIAYF